MQSVALSDSNADFENEYVIVALNSFEIEDDESYDCCDDVLSLKSMERPCLSVCSDTLKTLSEEITECAPVPSIIMQDLDDAHEAAQLASMDDDEGGERSLPGNHTTTSECAKQNQAESNDNSDNVEVGDKIRSISSGSPSKACDDDITPAMSRISNKKRRKKMKLMKKAAAAAAAAAALSEMTLSGRAMSKPSKVAAPKKKSKGNPSRFQSKRVANIAVACATESISAYKDELRNKNYKGIS